MDTAAEFTIEQRFENKESVPLEVEYQFRLDAKRSAVTKFVAFIDGKKGLTLPPEGGVIGFLIHLSLSLCL